MHPLVPAIVANRPLPCFATRPRVSQTRSPTRRPYRQARDRWRDGHRGGGCLRRGRRRRRLGRRAPRRPGRRAEAARCSRPILRRVPDATGVLFDRPEIVAEAGPTLYAAGVADRVDCMPGRLTGDVPPGGEVYVVARTLTGWADAHAMQLFRACREVMALSATVRARRAHDATGASLQRVARPARQGRLRATLRDGHRLRLVRDRGDAGGLDDLVLSHYAVEGLSADFSGVQSGQKSQ